jgi:hypothetical protein
MNFAMTISANQFTLLRFCHNILPLSLRLQHIGDSRFFVVGRVMEMQ